MQMKQKKTTIKSQTGSLESFFFLLCFSKLLVTENVNTFKIFGSFLMFAASFGVLCAPLSPDMGQVLFFFLLHKVQVLQCCLTSAFSFHVTLNSVFRLKYFEMILILLVCFPPVCFQGSLTHLHPGLHSVSPDFFLSGVSVQGWGEHTEETPVN